MKKKILFTTYSLDIGGIESALINMLKMFDYIANLVKMF